MLLSHPRNAFVSRDPFLWKKNLYTAYVRRHFEYTVVAWSPYTKEDKRSLENVSFKDELREALKAWKGTQL